MSCHVNFPSLHESYFLQGWISSISLPFLRLKFFRNAETRQHVVKWCITQNFVESSVFVSVENRKWVYVLKRPHLFSSCLALSVKESCEWLLMNSWLRLTSLRTTFDRLAFRKRHFIKFINVQDVSRRCGKMTHFPPKLNWIAPSLDFYSSRCVFSNHSEIFFLFQNSDRQNVFGWQNTGQST